MPVICWKLSTSARLRKQLNMRTATLYVITSLHVQQMQAMKQWPNVLMSTSEEYQLSQCVHDCQKPTWWVWWNPGNCYIPSVDLHQAAWRDLKTEVSSDWCMRCRCSEYQSKWKQLAWPVTVCWPPNPDWRSHRWRSPVWDDHCRLGIL